jgi:hypothetical protein
VNYSKGISWIDDCRIPFEDTQNPATNPKYRLQGNYKMPEKGQISDGSITQFRSSLNEIDVRGRFPANILVSDDMLNDGVISKSNDHKWEGEDTSPIYGKYENRTRTQVYSDKGSNSRYYNIDKWFEKLLDV